MMFRYIGNKTKLLPEIAAATKSIIGSNGTVADIMAGTGSVSAYYRDVGYRVIASDIMTYSKHHLNTQLMLSAPPSFSNIKSFELDNSDRYGSVISHLNDLDPVNDFFFREYSPEGTPQNGSPPRKYFTSENARKIDAIRLEINRLISTSEISSIEESVLKHSLIMAVNDVANISGTYGYFLSSFNKSSINPIVVRKTTFHKAVHEDNVVLQGFAEEIAPDISADLCYIDPPYMKRQYAANYHILETIARGDSPSDLIGMSGMRNWWPQHSKLCTKTRSRDSFKQIFSKMDCNSFLVSYNEDGLLTIDQLVEIMAEFGSVEVQTIEYSRFRSNSSNLPKNINEYLIELVK